MNLGSILLNYFDVNYIKIDVNYIKIDINYIKIDVNHDNIQLAISILI